MNTSDRTHDPLGLGERGEKPPTRYDSEGISLPERGSGYVSSGLDNGPREPEMLVIPAEAVSRLLMLAIQSQAGNLWWNGFVTAHGVPSWIADGSWRIEASGEAVVKPGLPNAPATSPPPTRVNGRP